jgi:hypothetical protein
MWHFNDNLKAFYGTKAEKTSALVAHYCANSRANSLPGICRMDNLPENLS